MEGEALLLGLALTATAPLAPCLLVVTFRLAVAALGLLVAATEIEAFAEAVFSAIAALARKIGSRI